MEGSVAPLVHERPRSRILTALLACGLLVAVVQIAGDIISAALYPGYSYVNQTVSELSAIGAPTRPFQAAVGFMYEALVLAFALGVWRMAQGRRNIKVVAVLLGVFALNAFVWGLFPMQERGSGIAATDVGHIVGAIVQVTTMVLFIAIGSRADGKWFRIFSVVLIIAILIAGAVSGTQAGQIAAGGTTPFLGLIERVGFYGPSIWILVLALELLRQQRRTQESCRATFASRRSVL